jgi:oligopeptide/dipeptide ABC transporter ATP-binding protein
MSRDVILDVRDLKKYYPVGRSLFHRSGAVVKAVDGVTFSVGRGETLALVGESGSGKTTTGRSILRLIEPSSGEITFYPKDGSAIDVAAADGADLNALRRSMQMVYQDPYSYMNPRMSVGGIVQEPLEVHGVGTRRERRDMAAAVLEAVGLSDEHLSRYPHAFSGGQRQRIAIARAIILNPSLVVADEPVSALDVSVQAQVLSVFQDLQEQLSLSYLFIAHDLSVVRHLATTIAVMYLGRIVESGPADEVFSKPYHPYTEALISAVPVPDPNFRSAPIVLHGDIPSPANPPAGCPFHTRCPYVQEICRTKAPDSTEPTPTRRSSCHFVAELSLQGIPAE